MVSDLFLKMEIKFNYSGDEEEMKKQIKEINEEDVKGYENL